jgi:aminoglycoside 2''-phosphotransferase
VSVREAGRSLHSPAASSMLTRGAVQRIAASLGSNGPVAVLGEGMDFVAYQCEDLVFRVAKRDEVAALVEAEYEFLITLPVDLPLAVPRPLCPPVASPGAVGGVLVYPVVAGTPLREVEGTSDLDVCQPIGRFLSALHSLPVGEVAPQSLGSLAEFASQRLADIRNQLGAQLTTVVRSALERHLPRAGSEQVMCHRDLTDDHVIVDLGARTVSGVIDFGDAGPSPWWHDLVGLWMWGGDEAVDSVCCAYGRQLEGAEQQLLEHHALAVAVADAVHASSRADFASVWPDHLSTLLQVLRR